MGSRSGPTFNGGIGAAHARSRRFLRVGNSRSSRRCLFLAGPVAPRLDTFNFKAMRWPRSLCRDRRVELLSGKKKDSDLKTRQINKMRHTFLTSW